MSRMKITKEMKQKLYSLYPITSHRTKTVRGKDGKPVTQKVIGRNHKCPCGSGKRYKRCCMGLSDIAIQKNEYSRTQRANQKRNK